MPDLSSPCADCRVETLPTLIDGPPAAEYYMVTHALWRIAGAPHRGYLCIGCLEHRIGRELTAADFTSCQVNDLTVAHTRRFAWSWRSPRLVDRLSRPAPAPPEQLALL